jgi:glycosyltransferase involved in cell wall biosynthesis
MNKYFLYVGSAYPHKNLKRLIEAIKLLNTKSNQLVDLLIVSGRGPFIERLNTSIVNIGAEKNVKLMGFVPDPKLKSLYQNSVGFVFPSLSEGFGLPGLEAMEAGTLLLASNIPVFKEVYEDEAIYFDPLNTESVTDAIRKVLQMSGGERNGRISKAKNFANRYSWAKMAKETLEIYEDCNNLR